MIRLNVDNLFLAFIFLVPLMPRPTAMGPERWVVPLLLSALIGGWFLFRPRGQSIRGGNLQLLAMILGFPLVAYLVRAVVQGGLSDELLQIISRVLFAVGLYVMAQWLCITKISKKSVFKAFMFGFLATSLITIFSGTTGVQILEEDSVKPSRFFGLTKSTGIFRSFGEFGIMACMAWTYLLMFAKDFKPFNWLVAMGMVTLAILISQSRNVYLVWVIATTLFVLFRYVRLPGFIRVSLAVVMILIPVGVDVAIPILKQTAIGGKLVGTGTILERNVDVRSEQFQDGILMVTRDPSGALVGYSRQAWRDLMMETHGVVVAPHNHFLSNIMFLGFVGGAVWIMGLYLLPSIKLSQAINSGDPVKQLALICLLGTIVGLSFYEGFFSVVVMVAVSMAWSLAYSYPPAPIQKPPTQGSTQQAAPKEGALV